MITLDDENLEGRLIYGKYKIIEKIGQGSFGQVYSAVNINDNEMVALKLENRNQDDNNWVLETESYLLVYLKGKGVPYIKTYGFSGDWNVIVMELLGKSVISYFEMCNGKFSLKTTLMIGYQMVSFN